MARVWFNSAGQILQVLSTWQKEQQQDQGAGTPAPPVGGVSPPLHIDEATNASLIASLQSPPTGTSFSCPGGTLTQTITVNGSPVSSAVAIQPPSGFYTLFLQADTLVAQLAGGVSLTPQQLGEFMQAFFTQAGVIFQPPA